MAERILVIDDDELVADVIVRLLRRSGYDSLSVAPGSGVMRRILAAHRERPVGLIILDLYMPAPDGFEVLQLIRELLEDLPVIGISGVSGALLNMMTTLGAFQVLEKPIDPEALMRTVQSALAASAGPGPAAQSNHAGAAGDRS